MEQHFNYDLPNTNNWGNSKGSTYEDVCVVLNPGTYKLYTNNKLNELNPETNKKLYVAITRAKGNVYFVEQKRVNKYRLK